MAKIKCEEKDCKYNNKSYCIKEGIYIGENAFCESFRKGKLDMKYAFEFSSFENDEKGIKCDAKDCLHNNNCICKASCIYISNEDILCKDYKKRK